MSQPEETYEVEEIVGRRVFSGKVLYLTKWKNFPLPEATWESVKVLKNYRHLIKHYNEQHRPSPEDTQHPLEFETTDLPPVKEEYSIRPVEPNLSQLPTSHKKRGRPPKKRQLAVESKEKKEDGKECVEKKGGSEKEKGERSKSGEQLGEQEESICVYWCGLSQKGTVDYIVGVGTDLKKYESSQMFSLYPKVMVSFLEAQLLKKNPFPSLTQ